MYKTEREDDHEKYKELCALAQTDLLGPSEQLELESHLRICDSCREIYEEYSLISKDGMAFLATTEVPSDAGIPWDDQRVRWRVFDAIRGSDPDKVLTFTPKSSASTRRLFPQLFSGFGLKTAFAACLMAAALTGAYYGGQQRAIDRQSKVLPANTSTSLINEHQTPPPSGISRELFAAQNTRIFELEARITEREKEIARLRLVSTSGEQHATQIADAYSQKNAELQQLIMERDRMAVQLKESQTTYQNLQAQFIKLRSDHDQALFRTASLESRVEELVSTTREQDRKLKDDAQYLTSDRDIRELMGARKLYIADVFDVDSGSRPRKPFGRVFYTQNKSLIFYAFDLDRQPGVKNASTFQVWGQRDSESRAEAHPMNLGILYMDSEMNRRWVLRYDDPKQLAEIDAVFVTVEPRGGSQKPTGKPFLYALLRKEANHP